MASFARKVYDELGLKALRNSSVDTKVLCLQRLVRFVAYGSSTLILTLFLVGLGHDATKIGLFMTLTLLGDVVISLVLTVVADKIGRRLVLALGSLLMAASGVVFAVCSQFWILCLASILGVISPSGNEIGPFRAIEESTIAHLTPLADRSSVLAWYLLFGTAGAAAGSIICGWVVHALQAQHNWSAVDSYRAVFWAYAVLGLIKLALSLMLSSDCEIVKPKSAERASDEHQPLLSSDMSNTNESVDGHDKKTKTSWLGSFMPELSSHTIGLLVRICLLFALDSLGSGIASTSWLVLFFHQKFGLQEGKLGSLFFITGILSAGSNLVAASIAKRIGLIKTMVFTHLPASVALIMLPIPNNQIVAMALLVVRASITSMDTAPRQAFLAAAVLPEERTTVMGIANVVKTLSQSGGPILAGIFAQAGIFGAVFILAGALKASYDLLMLAMFVGYRTIEEKAEEQVEQEIQREREEGTNQTLDTP